MDAVVKRTSAAAVVVGLVGACSQVGSREPSEGPLTGPELGVAGNISAAAVAAGSSAKSAVVGRGGLGGLRPLSASRISTGSRFLNGLGQFDVDSKFADEIELKAADRRPVNR